MAAGDRVPDNNVGNGAVRVDPPATILLVNATAVPTISVARSRPASSGSTPSHHRPFRGSCRADRLSCRDPRERACQSDGAGGARSAGAFLDRPRRRPAPHRRRAHSASVATSNPRSIPICLYRWSSRTSIASSRWPWSWRSIDPAAWPPGRRRPHEDGFGERGHVRSDRDARAIRRSRRHRGRQLAACHQSLVSASEQGLRRRPTSNPWAAASSPTPRWSPPRGWCRSRERHATHRAVRRCGGRRGAR